MAHPIRFPMRAAVVALLFGAMLCSLPAGAQTLYGSITGTVTDAQGAAVPGATVTATNVGTQHTVSVPTDSDGNYTMHNMLPGTYDLIAALTGFRELKQTGLRVTANTRIRVDIKLEVGALAETVTVVSESTLLQTEKADLNTELASKEIVNLPLNQFRNYQALLNLSPGATPAQFQNAEIDTPGRALRTSVNGMQGNSNAFRIDGAVSVNLWLPHHVGYVNSAETIDTVNISTNNFDADQGMAAGAAVTVVTKSGTNDLHGSAFFLRTQDEFNANTFNNNANGLAKPNLSNSIYGGTLGGPILRDKLFFFGAWERYQGRRGVNSTYVAPTAKMRAGDFSEVAAAYPAFRLYNPFTGGAGGVGRQEFPNYQIPASMLNATSQKVLADWPMPNFATDFNRNGILDDVVIPRTVKNDRDNFDLKLTWQRNNTHAIWAKFGMLDAEVVDNFILGFDQGSLGDTRTYVGTIGHTWTLSPSLVLDGNFGLNRMEQTVTGPDYGTNVGTDRYGIPGTNGDSIRASGVPFFDTTGVGGHTQANDYDFGATPNWMPLFRTEQSFTFSSALTKVMTKHELRFGIDVVRHELNHFQAEFGSIGGVRGRFTFGNDLTSTPGYVSPGWNSFGGFLLGLQTTQAKDVQEIEMTTREWQMAAYLRDRWQIGQKLTLSLGLRFEYYPLMKRKDSGIERLDLATYEALLGGRGSVPEDVGIDMKEFYLAPRIGAMYRLTEKTVLRAGYGRTINPLPWSRPMRGSFPYDIYYNKTAEQYGNLGTLESGIPPVVVPDLSSGRVKLPPNTFMRSPSIDDADRAVLQQANVAVEQRLPYDIALEVAYVYGKSDGGYADRNLNYGEPGGGQAARQYFPVAGTTDIWDWAGRTKRRYNALQVAVNRPYRNGLLLKGAYTLSEAKNETDEDGWTTLPWSHPSKLADNFALSGEDRTHMFQLGFLYDLPFAKGSKNVLGAIVKDWQINGIFSAYSGTPFSVGGTNPALNCQGCSSIGVLINVQGDPSPIGTPGSNTEPWYDKSLFSQPTGTGIDGFGTSRRNQFRTPSVWNMDLGIFRSFPVGKLRPELRVQITNLFNHTNWGRPVTSFTDPLFMTFTPSAAHQVNFLWGTATVERQIQLGLRLEF
jgi:Carboxypeptidase regulatory-like domain/TonB dependent receptor